MDTASGESYESLRPYLFAVAYRMTGAASDAEDLVQDAWIRYLDAGSPPVRSLRAYLTTIVSRLTLDYLKSARVAREQYVGAWLPEPVSTHRAIPGPDATIEQREAVSIAFLTLLERLTPEQRVVFVLRSGFGLPFAEIGDHLERSPAACRQLFQRAEHALAALTPDAGRTPTTDEWDVVHRFLGAVESGDLSAVTALLADGATWIGDGGKDHRTVRRAVRGADKVARGILGVRWKFPKPQVTFAIEDLNGGPAIVERSEGTIIRVTALTIEAGRIASIQVVLNPEKLRHLAQETAL
ncbi:MAG: RNA polymerase sigma factor SigJ [Thermomicrobiales bacterium]